MKTSLIKTLSVGLFICSALAGLEAHSFEPLPTKPSFPESNPYSKAKAELGKKLFFDPRISKAGNISCNSCHNVMLGGEDNRSFSFGVHGEKGGRSSPTVWNAAYNSVQFWDGRAPTLEEQAKGPIVNPKEMGMESHDLVMNRIREIPAYVADFQKVFGKNGLTIDNVAKAIATYERTLITPNSPFDLYLKGDKKALSTQALRGMKTVQETGCLACHFGPNFSGPKLPDGQGFFQKFPVFPGSTYEGRYLLTKDLGRFDVTKKEADKNMWRVPTWRNIALTAPYFHNGSVQTLDEAVRVMAKTQLNKTLTDEQVKDIVAFLDSLTGKRPDQTLPHLPPTLNTTLISD